MENHYLAKIIKQMADVDSAVRFHAKDSRGLQPANILIYAIDTSHNYRVHKIIKQDGYPTSKMVGKEGMKNWWLVIQHQDFDLELQGKCLKHCDFAPKECAYLTDRVLANKGKEQLYGTQFNVPIKDAKNVDTRRKKMGLSSLEEYKKESGCL